MIEAVRRGVGDDYRFMIDANHAYTTHDAFYVGRAMEEFEPYWFEEPVAPEDLDGYRELRQGLRVLALCHAHFTPVVNHVWGSAIAVATNMHLLAAMPPLPGGLFPWEPMLEFDTTHNLFRDDLLTNPLDIQRQVANNNGMVDIPSDPGLGVTPDRDFIRHYDLSN